MQMTEIRTNAKGKLHIVFDDVAAIRTDTVFFDRLTRKLSGLIDGWLVNFGEAPESLADSLCKQSQIQLSAFHPQGYALSMNAALQTI